MHAESFEHRAHRTTGDNARARRGSAQEYLARAVTAENIVMQRPAFAQRNACQAALGSICRLADRFRYFASLAVPKADPAFLAAHHHQRSNAETAAALDHLGHAVDVPQLVGELAGAVL